MKERKFDAKRLVNTILLGNKSYIILAVLVIVMACVSPLFLKQANILNVLRQACVMAIACAGFTMILASGHMDLSVGMILCACGVVVAKIQVAGLPIWFSCVAAILAGALMGAMNASLINAFALPAFIVTLATSNVFKGIACVVTKNVPVSGLSDSFKEIGQGYLGVIPIPIYVMAVSLAIMWVILNRTKLGRQAIAMGGNAEAARVSGIRTKRIRLYCYMILGAYTGLAAIIQTARSASAQLSAGSDLSMDAIASVVIGGTSMKGGNANVIGSLVGCLIVNIVNNGLNLLHVDANWQIAAKGFLILAAVVLDVVTTRIYSRISNKTN